MRSGPRGMVVVVAGLCSVLLHAWLGLDYAVRISDHRVREPPGVRTRMSDHARPAGVTVVLTDGLSLHAATRMRSHAWFTQRGACGVVDVGWPSLSRPVYAMFSTGIVPAWSGVRTNAAHQPLRADNVWQVFRDAGWTVGVVSSLPWWGELFPEAWSAHDGAARVLEVSQSWDVALLHDLSVDDAGHQHGGASREYAVAVEALDARFHSWLGRVDARRLVVWVSDHGHTSRGGHGGDGDDVRRVALCLAGPNVTPVVLPDVDGADVAALVAALAGVDSPAHARMTGTLSRALRALWVTGAPPGEAPPAVREASGRWSMAVAALMVLSAFLLAWVGSRSLRGAGLALGAWMSAAGGFALVRGGLDWTAGNTRQVLVQAGVAVGATVATAAWVFAARRAWFNAAAMAMIVSGWCAIAAHALLLGVNLEPPLPAAPVVFAPVWMHVVGGTWSVMAAAVASGALLHAWWTRRSNR